MDPKFFRKYSDMIVEAENLTDINQVAAGLEFLPTTKLPALIVSDSTGIGSLLFSKAKDLVSLIGY